MVTVTPGPGPSLVTNDEGIDKNNQTGIFENTTILFQSSQSTETNNSNITKPFSFANMLEEFMSDFNNNESPNPKKTTSNEHFNTLTKNKSEKDDESEIKKAGKRFGVWRRVRVRPVDGLEVAESQNIGSQFINSVVIPPLKNFGERLEKYEKKEIVKNSIMEEEDSSISSTITTTSLPTEPTTTEIFEFETEDSFMPEVTTESNQSIEDVSTILPISKDLIIESTDSLNGSEHFGNKAFEKFEEDYQLLTTTQSPSIFDEVKQKLSDLFAMTPDDDEDIELLETHNKPQYINIQRSKIDNVELPTTTDETSVTEISQFPKDFMGNLIYATSTSTEVSHETEICYRGKCVKTEDKKNMNLE